MTLVGLTAGIFIREIKCTFFFFLLNSVFFNYEHVPTHNLLLLNLYEIKNINKKNENTVNHLSESNKIPSVGAYSLYAFA